MDKEHMRYIELLRRADAGLLTEDELMEGVDGPMSITLLLGGDNEPIPPIDERDPNIMYITLNLK